MRVIFIGPPGAGKGTQAEVISREKGIAHISTGDILRKNVVEQTDLGKAAREYMDAGKLVPDDIIIGMMEKRLGEKDCRKGFILDGFPRTVPQAEALEELLGRMGILLDAVILFQAPDEVVIRRLSGRRVCRSCGAIFNVRWKPPGEDDRCDKCGGDLYQRDDDREDVVKNRLDVYKRQTAPLIGYYREKGLLVEVDASRESAEVVADIISSVKGSQ
ncbi:MAG: adenylate kinase [Thermovirgaceae bacterium]